MKLKFTVFLALGVLCVSSASAATIVFTSIEVSNPSGGYYNTGSIPGGTAFGGISINDSLQIVGSYNPTGTTYYGFSYNGTTLTMGATGYQQSLNSGTAQTAPHGINNNGTEIGLYEAQSASPVVLSGYILGGSSDATYGSVANPTGTINPNVNGEGANWNFFFNGIGNSGDVVGFYTPAQDSGGGTTHGFIYTGGSGAADTGGTFNSSAAESTYTSASNSSLYLCADSATSTLGTSNNFEAVNSSGVVAGYCAVSSVKDGLTFNGTSYSLYQYSGSTATELFAIDDSGDIGGDFQSASGANTIFLCTSAEVAAASYNSTTGISTLNGCTTYSAASAASLGLTDPEGNSISQVYLSGMNNKGDFVGVYQDTGGNTFAFVAESPAVGVPEPGTMALFSVAGAAFLLSRKRRRT